MQQSLLASKIGWKRIENLFQTFNDGLAKLKSCFLAFLQLVSKSFTHFYVQESAADIFYQSALDIGCCAKSSDFRVDGYAFFAVACIEGFCEFWKPWADLFFCAGAQDEMNSFFIHTGFKTVKLNECTLWHSLQPQSGHVLIKSIGVMCQVIRAVLVGFSTYAAVALPVGEECRANRKRPEDFLGNDICMYIENCMGSL